MTGSVESTEQVNSESEPACQSVTGDFVAGLDALRGRLVADITYRQYIDSLEEIRETYDDLAVGRLKGGGCLEGAGFAEDAFNRYIAAANEWSRCLSSPPCDAEAIELALRKRWWAAGVILSRAHAALPNDVPAYLAGLPPPP